MVNPRDIAGNTEEEDLAIQLHEACFFLPKTLYIQICRYNLQMDYKHQSNFHQLKPVHHKKINQTLFKTHTKAIPGNGFNFHAGEAKCTVAFNTDNTFAWSIVSTPQGGSQSKAYANAHCSKGASIQSGHTQKILRVGKMAHWHYAHTYHDA